MVQSEFGSIQRCEHPFPMNVMTSGYPQNTPQLGDAQLLELYEQMLLIRRFEERAGQLYGQGEIGGFCHLYIGQEAVAVGVFAAMEKDDHWITGYRDHGHALLSGATPEQVMAELTGRAAGMNKGKGGSMHMFWPEGNFYGGHGIVGAQVPLGAGLAFASQYRDEDNVTFVFFGDGAANQGQVYETFNMAKLWNLPVIFVIENNQYAMGTSVQRASSETHLYKRGVSFGIPGEEMDGMNVLEVYAHSQKAAEHVREGGGPYMLEMKTYRYRGHSMSDPAKYRPKDEPKKVRESSDPIEKLKSMLLEHGVAQEEALKEKDKAIRAEVAQAAQFAVETPPPADEALYELVYPADDG